MDTLRVPITGTLEDLERRYRAFHDRLGRDGFNPPPPLTAFVVQGYHRSGARPSCPFAAFEIWKPIRELAELPAGRSMARPFDPVRSAVVVAAMVRAAAARAAKADGWPEGRIRTYIHGHAADGGGPARGPGADRRLAFLPLPSITPLRVESIRRVLVVAPPGDVGEVEWLRETLAGQQLQPENGEGPVATLTPLRGGDANLRYYIQEAQVWSTVTPVVLPGRFTKGVGRTMRLLRAALAQAGWPRELIAGAEFDWREEGYRRGVDLARRYRVPEQLRHLAKQHLRIRWPVPVRGPLALGAGRYRGVGVFAAEV